MNSAASPLRVIGMMTEATCKVRAAAAPDRDTLAPLPGEDAVPLVLAGSTKSSMMALRTRFKSTRPNIASLAMGSETRPRAFWEATGDFHALLTKRGSEQAALVAFDLLRLGGDDLRQRPLKARREALMRLVAKRRGDGIVFNEALDEEGAVVFANAAMLGPEGIVSKRAGSFYRSGPSRNWLKTKNPDFVRT
jgi:ATP dependent DNA ligase domain